MWIDILGCSYCYFGVCCLCNQEDIAEGKICSVVKYTIFSVSNLKGVVRAWVLERDVPVGVFQRRDSEAGELGVV